MNSTTLPDLQRRPAFMTISLGGSGERASSVYGDLYVADGSPFPMVCVHIDTDPVTQAVFDESILLPLDADKLSAIQDNPELFGPNVGRILKEYSEMLHPEDVCNGSRTTRALTQLAFEYYRGHVLRGLRNALFRLKSYGGFDYVVLTLISSSGGGAGSALQILLAQALSDPSFRNQLLEGFTLGLLSTPIAFVVEPFAFAERHDALHADKILANAYAFRLESAILEARRAYTYIFHLGLSNNHGAVLLEDEEIANVLGSSVYLFQRHWPEMKRRFVDTVDTHVLTARYGGFDIPEIRRPPAAGPSGNGNGKAPYP